MLKEHDGMKEAIENINTSTVDQMLKTQGLKRKKNGRIMFSSNYVVCSRKKSRVI